MIYNARTVKQHLSNTAFGAEAQHGFDVTLYKVEVLEGVGSVSRDKTDPPSYRIVEPSSEGFYRLLPGYYKVTFNEGGAIPQGMAGLFKARSSLIRCGVHLETGLYDAGFGATHFGGFLVVHKEFLVERNARVAQFLLVKAQEVGSLYSGQWQQKH